VWDIAAFHRIIKEHRFHLGQWVRTQRTRKVIPSDQRRRLDDLGFDWKNPYEAKWEEGFSRLQLFKEREGHCRVPLGYQENGFRLGTWVGKQRAKKDKLSDQRRRRLNELGFVWKVR
jgi:hypothetical protein